MNGLLAGTLLAGAAMWGVAHVQLRLPGPPPGGSARGQRPAGKRRRLRRGAVDVNGIVTEVATRLRSGVGPAEAWAAAARRRGLPTGTRDDVPEVLLALPAGPGPAGALAATRLAAELGAPLADVLDGCSAGILAAEEAEAARSLALAGPVATARLLAAMPAVGLALGLFMGADPIGQLLGGGIGTLAGMAGIALAGAGARWTAALVRRARVDDGGS